MPSAVSTCARQLRASTPRVNGSVAFRAASGTSGRDSVSVDIDSSVMAALRQTVRQFVQAEVAPFVDEWEAKGDFVPLSVVKKAGELGLLRVGFPEPWYATVARLFFNRVPMGGGSQGFTLRLPSSGATRCSTAIPGTSSQ